VTPRHESTGVAPSEPAAPLGEAPEAPPPLGKAPEAPPPLGKAPEAPPPVGKAPEAPPWPFPPWPPAFSCCSVPEHTPPEHVCPARHSLLTRHIIPAPRPASALEWLFPDAPPFGPPELPSPNVLLGTPHWVVKRTVTSARASPAARRKIGFFSIKAFIYESVVLTPWPAYRFGALEASLKFRARDV